MSTSSSTPRPTWAPGARTSTSTSPRGRQRAERLLADADVVVDNYRLGSLARRGLDPHDVADRHPGVVFVSVTCYGPSGPWPGRGGFDMNGSAASGLMTVEGSDSEPRLPVTCAPQRLHHRLHGGNRRRAGRWSSAPNRGDRGTWPSASPGVPCGAARSGSWIRISPAAPGSTASRRAGPLRQRQPPSGLSTCSLRPSAFRTRRPRVG